MVSEDLRIGNCPHPVITVDYCGNWIINRDYRVPPDWLLDGYLGIYEHELWGLRYNDGTDWYRHPARGLREMLALAPGLDASRAALRWIAKHRARRPAPDHRFTREEAKQWWSFAQLRRAGLRSWAAWEQMTAAEQLELVWAWGLGQADPELALSSWLLNLKYIVAVDEVAPVALQAPQRVEADGTISLWQRMPVPWMVALSISADGQTMVIVSCEQDGQPLRMQVLSPVPTPGDTFPGAPTEVLKDQAMPLEDIVRWLYEHHGECRPEASWLLAKSWPTSLNVWGARRPGWRLTSSRDLHEHLEAATDIHVERPYGYDDYASPDVVCERARQIGIRGRSVMSTDELRVAIAEAAEHQAPAWPDRRAVWTSEHRFLSSAEIPTRVDRRVARREALAAARLPSGLVHPGLAPQPTRLAARKLPRYRLYRPRSPFLD